MADWIPKVGDLATVIFLPTLVGWPTATLGDAVRVESIYGDESVSIMILRTGEIRHGWMNYCFKPIDQPQPQTQKDT